MAQDSKSRLAGVAARLAGPIARELERYRQERRDQAHIATLGDHPFTGCQPCAPSPPAGPADPGEAPQARAKNERL